jgi:hypothetical protein
MSSRMLSSLSVTIHSTFSMAKSLTRRVKQQVSSTIADTFWKLVDSGRGSSFVRRSTLRTTREGSSERFLWESLTSTRAREQSNHPEIRRKPRETIVDPRGDDREEIRRRLLSEGRWLGVDIEYIKPVLKWVGFAVSSDWAVSIKIRGPEDILWCKELIESGKPLLFQNAMYDCGMFEWFWDIDAWSNLAYDTMVAAYNINMEYPKDLGFLGSMYTDVAAWWDVVDWDKIHKGEQSIDILGPYNCYDGMVTVETAEKQQPEP